MEYRNILHEANRVIWPLCKIYKWQFWTKIIGLILKRHKRVENTYEEITAPLRQLCITACTCLCDQHVYKCEIIRPTIPPISYSLDACVWRGPRSTGCAVIVNCWFLCLCVNFLYFSWNICSRACIPFKTALAHIIGQFVLTHFVITVRGLRYNGNMMLELSMVNVAALKDWLTKYYN